jgi:hypothetical protein
VKKLRRDGRWCGFDYLLTFPDKTKIWNRMGEWGRLLQVRAGFD